MRQRPGNSVEEKDGQTGMLTSAPFKVQRKFLSFYIGGGRRDGLRAANCWWTGKWCAPRPVTTTTECGARPWTFRNSRGATWWSRLSMMPKADGAIPAWITSCRPMCRKRKCRWKNSRTSARWRSRSSARGRPTRIRLVAGSCRTAAFGLVKSGDGAGRNAHRFGGAGTGHRPRQIRGIPFRARVAFSQDHFARARMRAPAIIMPTGSAMPTAVATYVAAELPRLESLTRLWRDTWYDSTLPHWFLDRTFANTSILATTTAHRFASGRFWGWEGIGCCEGTCTHVWHYAQAMGRIFPELERDQRERVDFGVGFEPGNGVIRHRARRHRPGNRRPLRAHSRRLARAPDEPGWRIPQARLAPRESGGGIHHPS